MEDIDDRRALKRERHKQVEDLRKRAKRQLDDDAYEEALRMVMNFMASADREVDRIDDDMSDSEVRQILGTIAGLERQALTLIGNGD
jgi:heme oxygenase